MLSLYSSVGFSAYASYAQVSTERNPFTWSYKLEPEKIELIKFQGIRNLSADYITNQLLPITRRAGFCGGSLWSSIRNARSIDRIESQSDKVLVCLRKFEKSPRFLGSIPDLFFVLCNAIAISSKSGGKVINLKEDDTCFILHGFELINFPSKDNSNNVIVDLVDYYAGKSAVKGKDLILDCFAIDGQCVLFRVEPYAVKYQDGRGNDGKELPRVTSIDISDDNTLTLVDGSSDWVIRYGVRLVHNQTKEIHKWERKFSNRFVLYSYLNELDLEKRFADGYWQPVWVWGGKSQIIIESEVIDNR